MKILMLGWELPPYNSGGMGVACYYMSKALALQGAEIDFIVPYSADHSEIDFMTVHGATKLSPLDKYGLGVYDSANYLKQTEDAPIDIRAVRQNYMQFVERFLKNNKPDTIHAHDWLTMEAGMRAKELTGAPLIVHVHATEFDRAGSERGNPLVHEIEYNGLVMADRIIAVSNATKGIIMQKYKIPADKIEVVYNAVDIASLNNDYSYDYQTYTYLEALKSEGYTIVSSIGRATVQKGLVHLMGAFAKACSKYDKLALLFVGDGEQKDELVELTADLGIADKVFFTGFLRGQTLRDSYSVSEVFVMSSISEPFGLGALEAAHHDNAVIVTKQSGVGEVLESVFKYDFWDEDKLANEIIAIATSSALKNELTTNVKNEYNRLSWDDVADACLSIYRRLSDGVKV